MPPLFTKQARWIWDQSDRLGYNYPLRARRKFSLTAIAFRRVREAHSATLKITAEANYQVWLNGTVLGHGPAKSPENERFVDTYDLSAELAPGENFLEILVLSIGVGTMTYVCGEAGLIFEIHGPGFHVFSDSRTLVQRDPQRPRSGTRRWVLPCIEDIQASAKAEHWHQASVVEKTARLLQRPVSLPSREPHCARRLLTAEIVKLPNFSTTFRIKPHLVPEEEQRVTTVYERVAYILTDIVSPKAQTITLTPTPGQITWYFQGEKIVTGSGWGLWDPATQKPVLRLRRGANRLVGLHGHNFFDDIHLAGFAEYPVEFRNPFGVGAFQVALPRHADAKNHAGGVATSALEGAAGTGEDRLPEDFAEKLAACDFPKMKAAQTLPGANFQSLAVGALIDTTRILTKASLVRNRTYHLPAAPAGSAVRVVIDLGVVHNGWLAFSALGKRGSRLIFSFFEGVKSLQPLDFHWPEASNNALSYRFRDGWQKFESFFPYGVRYIAIHHEGLSAVELKDLTVLSANCGQLSQGAFLSDDLTLNAIYAICEQTVLSATDDTLTDCPTYEAANWNFDNRLGAMADLVMGRNIDVIANTLEQFARDPRYPGLVRSHYPSSWDNRIPVFSFHWILACHDFFRATADRTFALRMIPTITAGLDEAITLLNPLGLLEWPSGKDVWHIIDWQKERDDGHAIVSAEQAVLLGALLTGIDLLKVTKPRGWSARARRWESAHRTLKAAINRHLWVQSRNAFADSLHADGSLSSVSSQPSNAALAFHGAGTPEWWSELALRLEKKTDGLLPFGSPMGLFYVLEFLDQHGRVDAIFDLIRERWKPILESGDGTAWEHFPEYGFPGAPTRSRCHPFATYIVKYYVKYLLGLEARSPGDTVFRFYPRPPRGVESCQGILPTSTGDIRVSWKNTASGREQSLHLPKGIKLAKS